MSEFTHVGNVLAQMGVKPPRPGEGPAIPRSIKGLSISRPWPWAFEHPAVPKRIENRTWKKPFWADWIALHAAKSWDQTGLDYLQRVCPEIPTEKALHPDSQIFAVCRVKTCLKFSPMDVTGYDAKRLFGDQGIWAFGPFCWVIIDLVMLKDPVPCSGARGLWSLEDDAFEALHESYLATVGRCEPETGSIINLIGGEGSGA